MVIAVILVTYFIDHVLDKKYPWIWPSLLCASGFGICCSTYLFLDMPIIDTWIFLFPLFYSVFFFSNSLKAKILWNTILLALFNGIAILCTSFFSKALGPSSSYLEIGSADRVAFVVSFNVSLAVSLYFVTRPKRSPRVGAWVFAVFALLNFLVADIIDLLFLLRSSENLNDSVLLLASAMALGISALSVFLYSAMMRYAEREYQNRRRIDQLNHAGAVPAEAALHV